MTTMVKDELREFWEKCGFRYTKVGQGHKPDFVEYYEWLAPDGEKFKELPPIDLEHIGFLFKYAVPKVILKVGVAGLLHILNEWVYHVVMDSEDPAQALYKALKEVL